MNAWVWRVAALWACATAGGGVSAPLGAQTVPTLSDRARVALISILPGEDVYSTFGHSAIRITDPVLGIDESYNFGTFDFGDSAAEIASFVARFTYGDLDYRLSVQNGARVVDFYWEELGRATIQQTLALTRSQRQAMFASLRINALPANMYYQYDFFFDNCATRLLDVIEASAGPSIAFEAHASGRSFRQLLDPYLGGAPWTHFGMDLGLGSPADRIATAREETFLPELLMEYVATGRIGSGASSRPLVARTDTLTGGGGSGWEPESATPWPMLVMWVLFVLGLAFTIADIRSGRTRHRVVDSVFFGVLGAAGLVVVFLWFISLHEVTDGNLNLAWALPTHLLAAWAIARHTGRRWLGAYMAITALAALVVLAGLPLWEQEIPTAVIPLLLLIAVRAGGLVRVRLNPPG